MRVPNLRLRLSSSRVFGSASPSDLSREAERLFVVAVTDNGTAKIFDFDMTDDGMESLMNLLRAEEVVGVISGRKLAYQAESRVCLNLHGRPVESSVLLRKG